MQNKTITAVINTHNRCDMLGDAVMSVFSQTRPVDKLIIVDDGSTDTTQDVVGRLREKAPVELQYLHQPASGLYPSRNKGLFASDADYVAFLDDDDIWLPTHIERLMALAYRYPKAVFLGGFIAREGSGEIIEPSLRLLEPFEQVESGVRLLQCQGMQGVDRIFFAPHLSASMMHLASAQSVGFDGSMIMRGDVLIVWELSRKGDILIDERVHAHAKRVADSLSSGIDIETEPRRYHEMRASACRWQAYAISRLIGDRPLNTVPSLRNELGNELVARAIHLQEAGSQKEAITVALKAFRSSPSILRLRTLVRTLVGLRSRHA